MWVQDRQTTIYSRAKAMLTAKLKKTYPNLYVTQDNKTPTQAQFPCVYIEFIGASERGATLDGTTINAINLTAEVHIKVTSTQGMLAAQDVSFAVLEVFKSMRFQATLPNIPTSNAEGVYEVSTRYSRVIGQGDVI